jgi:hypothetical protein
MRELIFHRGAAVAAGFRRERFHDFVHLRPGVSLVLVEDEFARDAALPATNDQ